MRLLWAAVIACTALPVSAETWQLQPEPAPAAFAERDTPYSMVYYYLNNDTQNTQWLIGTLRDLGVTHAQALIYWWKAETFGGDYWREQYTPNQIGDNFIKAMDLFVETCEQHNIKPAFRLGSRDFQADLWHPADPSDSIEPYADWVRRMAERYKGRVNHYVIGDEEHKARHGFGGSQQRYMDEFLIPMSRAIRAGDPDALIITSSSRMDWNLDLIDAGAPDYADGMASNLPHRHWELRSEIGDYMAEARRRWPDVKFHANGVGYAENTQGQHDALQAARIAQSMFTAWRMGWDNAPYYLYRFGKTADTRQDFGILRFRSDDRPAVYSDAWFAYQTIAQTFYNRKQLQSPRFEIELVQAQSLGSRATIAPPDVEMHTFVRADAQLLIYLAYNDPERQRHGRWNVVLHTDAWGGPQQIPLLDYQQRIDLPSHRDSARLVIENVEVSTTPTILTLRHRVHVRL